MWGMPASRDGILCSSNLFTDVYRILEAGDLAFWQLYDVLLKGSASAPGLIDQENRV